MPPEESLETGLQVHCCSIPQKAVSILTPVPVQRTLFGNRISADISKSRSHSELGWVLTQCGWCPYQRRDHREDRGRGWSYVASAMCAWTAEAGGARKGPPLEPPRCGPQNCERMYFHNCYHPVCGIWLRQPSENKTHS